MKKSAREKNSIIIWFVFYFVLLFGVILFFSISTVESLNEIEEKKVLTKDIYNDIVEIESKWLSYNEFKSITDSAEASDEYKVVLKNMTKSFYEEHLMNKNEATFKKFIEKKTKEIKSPENEKLISENEKQIVNILPTYSENNINIWEKSLTDFEFINYIESIIDSFNLSSKASLGIWNVQILDEYVISTWVWNSMDSNIYSIPLSLNLEWTKKNIINFLYFIEKVWTIKTLNNEIIINEDSAFLSTNGFVKVLSGDKYTVDYNIFEHQIIDINNISMPEYLDSSYLSRNETKFIDFIKGSQWNDHFEIKVNLLFYVKWLPKYRVVDSINKITLNFKLLYWYVNKTISSWKVKWIELIKLKKYQNLLKNVNLRVVWIWKELKSNKNLELIYKKALNVNEIITPLCDKYSKICK